MINNNNVKIIVYESSHKFINYLIYNKIKYESLEKNNDCFYLVTDYNEYKKISRRYKTKIIKYYGKRNIKNIILNNKYLLISFLISLIILYLLTNTIFKIEIKTNDEEVKTRILESLNKNGISLYKKKKNFKSLTKIKEKILSENEDILEWIEINDKGCIYEIDLTRRVINKENNIDATPSSIIAEKDGLIKHITVSSGVKMKEINEYVKKGDTIISGNVIKNNELITQVKSSGEVYAETWYFVNINVPFNYIEYEPTGKTINRYYLDIFGTEFTLIGKYDSNKTLNTKKLILDKPYLFFKLYKEEKQVYNYKEYNIGEKEAYEKALKESEKQILKRLNKDEYIISKKVLKKEVNSSKIYLEVFFKVYENIAVNTNVEEFVPEITTMGDYDY